MQAGLYKEKENHNDQYCNYNDFCSLKFTKITLKREGMRPYATVDISDWKIIMKFSIFDLQHS